MPILRHTMLLSMKPEIDEQTRAACVESLLAIKDKVATIRAMQILSKDQIVGSNADYEMRTDFDDEAGYQAILDRSRAPFLPLTLLYA